MNDFLDEELPPPVDPEESDNEASPDGAGRGIGARIAAGTDADTPPPPPPDLVDNSVDANQPTGASLPAPVSRAVAADTVPPAPAASTIPAPRGFGSRLGTNPGVTPEVVPDPSAVTPSSPNLPAVTARQVGPGDIPQPPTGANNQRRMDLLKQMGVLSHPTDRNAIDPQTGKPMYRMGLGQRIAGIIANFGNGFARNGRPPVYIGPGATNSRYARAESDRLNQLEGVKGELGEQEKLDQSENKIYEDAMRQTYENQLGTAREGLADAAQKRAATAGELADTKAQLARTQGDLNEAKAQHSANAPPTNEFSGWYSAFTKDNGRPPNARDIQQYEVNKARAGKDTSAADTAKAIQVAEYKGRELDRLEGQKEQERRSRYAELDKNLKLKYNDAAMADERKKVDDQLETKYAQKVQGISDEADKMLGLTKAGSKLRGNAQPSPTPGRAAAKAPEKPTKPAPAGKVWVYEKSSGTRGLIPSNQLAKATQGPNAKYATW
jgi:hypothetical protein